MTPEELVNAAEVRLRYAENNLAGCTASLDQHKQRHGGVPNSEVMMLAHAQAAVAQAYAALALAKAVLTLVTMVGDPGASPGGDETSGGPEADGASDG